MATTVRDYAGPCPRDAAGGPATSPGGSRACTLVGRAVGAPEGPLRLVALVYGPVRTELVAEARLAASGETFRLRAHAATDDLPADLAVGSMLRASVAPEHVLRFGR